MATPTLTFAKLAEEPHLSDIYIQKQHGWKHQKIHYIYIYIEIDVRSMNV